MLAGALLVTCLYAAFAHGAVASPDEERVQLGLAVVALLAAAAWCRHDTPMADAPGLVRAGLGSLTAFAAWSGVSVLWSVAPDRTWTECNRVITYCLVLVLALAVGASLRRGVKAVTEGLMVVCLAVTVYALGQKLVPGLHLGGVFTLDQTSVLARLQEPLGYWNALALLVAMAVPAALSIVVDRARPDPVRLAASAASAASAAMVAMLLTIGFTYSRGGVLALLVALALTVTLSGAWLRCLMWLAAVAIAATPVLWWDWPVIG